MNLQNAKLYTLTLLKWIGLATLCGLVVGPIGTLFVHVLEAATHLRGTYPWLIYFLPFAGLIVVYLYRHVHLSAGGSTNAVFIAVRDNETMPSATAPLIFFSTALTHLFGGSAGREGAALQLGGSITGKIGRMLHLSDKDCRMMTLCGMSAAFAAVFGTPLTAAVFSMEVVSVGVMYYAALVPCFLSAMIGVWIAEHLGAHPHVYPLTEFVELSPLSMGRVILLAVILAVLSIFVCKAFRDGSKLLSKWITNPYIRVLAGGGAIIALTLLLGTYDYNGAGNHIIEQAIAGEAVPYAFLLKILFTAITLGVGYKGGEIVPVFFIGATFGCTFAPLLGLPAGFGAALGMVGLFCGVTNSPLASLLLAIELFGTQSVPMFAMVCVVSYMLSGFSGLYSQQKIVYSKLGLEFVDRKVGDKESGTR